MTLPCLSRRSFVAGTIAASLPVFSERASAQAGKLAVSWYPGLLGSNFKKAFLDTFDAKDSVQITESWDSPRFTQMQASRNRPNVDVATFIDVLMPIVSNSGLLAKLAPAAIPNLASVDQELLIWNGLAVPASYGSWGIMYNKKRVSKPLTSWGDLLREDLKGHVSHPNVTYNSSIYSLDALARLGGGDLKSPDAGMKSIRQIRLSGPGLWDQESIAVGWMKTEEIWATPYFSGNALALMEDKDVPELGFVVPSEGAYAVPFNITKIANGPNAADADRFINHILSEAAQTAWVAAGRSRPARKGVQVPAAVAATVPVISQLRRIDWAYFTENRSAIVAKWNEMVNG